jgi:hypothetical protein
VTATPRTGIAVNSNKTSIRPDDPRAVLTGNQLVRTAQHIFGVHPRACHDTRRQLTALPYILMCGLRDGDIELVVHPGLQTLFTTLRFSFSECAPMISSSQLMTPMTMTRAT